MKLRIAAKRVYYRAVITSAQCRAAHALLGMTQAGLARVAGVSVLAIKRFEGGSDSRSSTVSAIEDALDKVGVLLIPADQLGGPGVRLAKSD